MIKRRICVFCETWASGGIESFLTNVLLRQEMSEMEIDLVVAEKRDSVYTATLEAHGIRFISLSGSPTRLISNWNQFRRLLVECRYDTVYINAFQALSLRYGLLARRAGVPVRILHSHSSDIRVQPFRTMKLLIHRIAEVFYSGVGTEYFACSGEAAAFLFSPRLREKQIVRFIPNGIDTGRFCFQTDVRDHVRDELGFRDRFVLGNIGRLSSQKNQLFLLDVLKAILPIRPNACLLLIGEGKLRQDLEKRAAELQIQEHVLFYGVTDKPWELYWAMDVFLFPSLFEGLGIAAVEAQCAGLPQVCSEHVPEEALVTDLAHRVPLTGGAEAWAKAVAGLEPPEKRKQYAAKVREAGFDIESVSRIIRSALMGSETQSPPQER
jgi:glycosyltransferase involved in cell wall biosynthesis